MMDPRDRLIVALDVSTVDEAQALINKLGEYVSFYKVGLELVMCGGVTFVNQLVVQRKRVFLDMKLLDISNTVERATANASELGVDFLTIHGHDTKTMKAAVAGRGKSKLKLLAVTVLTHLSRQDLSEQMISADPASLVLHRARLAKDAGCDGVICSANEAREIRQAVGKDFLIVTPGIRLPDDEKGDQVRVTTPEIAIEAGADYLVVGRPITQAKDPKQAATNFSNAISSTLTRCR